jgi:hypothetical protein
MMLAIMATKMYTGTILNVPHGVQEPETDKFES